VVRHARGTDEYEVRVEIGTGGCAIEVVDVGPGFGARVAPASSEAESGRGLYLMRALMDDLEFVREDSQTRVRLVKHWEPTATELTSP